VSLLLLLLLLLLTLHAAAAAAAAELETQIACVQLQYRDSLLLLLLLLLLLTLHEAAWPCGHLHCCWGVRQHRKRDVRLPCNISGAGRNLQPNMKQNFRH
jgi:hypothetical protein